MHASLCVCVCVCVRVCMCVYTHWVIEWREQKGKEDGVKEANSNHKLPQAFTHGPPQQNHTHTCIYLLTHTCTHTWLYTSTNAMH